MDLTYLLDEGVTAERRATVTESQATTVFGDHPDPPARPAAGDARPEEATDVLGSPGVLAWVEFVGRDALHGRLPDGTGTVGVRAELDHLGAAPVGAEILVRTDLTAVEDATLTVEGRIERADGRPVGEVTTLFRVVDRDRFRASLDE
ncbi:thioesterase family protein [Halosegnis marinus]|uniref:Thioesterase family protein n=1 Tax=Halosegnis marinus TaxID=3034023 RepID=A0ABD5ZPV4_9EURY|nr:hotdog domain-containing protein [Halosegnis sp. DT85]